MTILLWPAGPEVSAQDLTEDEEAEAVDEDIVDDVTAEDEDDEAEVEDDENTELVSRLDFCQTCTAQLCIACNNISETIWVWPKFIKMRHYVTIGWN